MAIYVARITKVSQELPPAPDKVLNLNCLNWFPNNILGQIPLYELAPYHLKDAEGHLFENIYQFSKLYSSVDPQHEIKAGKLIWSHPSEVHVRNNQLTPEFWEWRKKGWNNSYPVRYPNGFYGRHQCICSLWCENGVWTMLSYIAARKKIYCQVYSKLVKETTAYAQLKTLHDSGIGLQICEMDVRPGLITEEVLKHELNNPKAPFGHGYVLATCLLGLEHLFTE